MGARNVLRLHYPDGRVVTRTMAEMAHENATTVAGARDLIAQWVTACDLVERPDGGFDVINYRPPRVTRRTPRPALRTPRRKPARSR